MVFGFLQTDFRCVQGRFFKTKEIFLAKQLNISPHQLSYVTHSGSGEGLLFYGNTILPFVDHFPHDLELYKIMTTKLSEVTGAEKHE